MDDLRGKSVLVTGAARGIGKAVSAHLLDLGCRVVMIDVDADRGATAAGELRARGEADFVNADVGDEEAVRQAVDRVIELSGSLHGLVNNAGIAQHHTGPVSELELERWNQILRTNLTGAFLCAKHAAEPLRRGGGAIVNIASTRAIMSEPQSEAYAASKGGLVALSHALAISLGPQVRVNCISPGWIDTRSWDTAGNADVELLRPIDHAQHPVGRVGTPEDVARLVAYLLSSSSGFLTGQNVVLDGGMTRRMIYEP